MTHTAKHVFLTAIIAGLVWLLGNTVFTGIKTGNLRHTDTTRVCNKDKNPVCFWALMVLFIGFIAMLGWVWVSAVLKDLP